MAPWFSRVLDTPEHGRVSVSATTIPIALPPPLEIGRAAPCRTRLDEARHRERGTSGRIVTGLGELSCAGSAPRRRTLPASHPAEGRAGPGTPTGPDPRWVRPRQKRRGGSGR